MSILTCVNDAAKLLPTTWPLQASIAVNPLWEYVDKPIELAVRDAKPFLNIHGCLQAHEYLEKLHHHEITFSNIKDALLEHLQQYDDCTLDEEKLNKLSNFFCAPNLLNNLKKNERFFLDNPSVIENNELNILNKKMIEFLLLFFNEQLRALFLSDNDHTLFGVWKTYIVHQDKNFKKIIAAIPKDTVQAIGFLVDRLNIEQNTYTDLFKLIFSQHLGWNSFIKWLATRQKNPFFNLKASLTDILLIWLCYLYVEFQNKPLELDSLLKICQPRFKSLHEILSMGPKANLEILHDPSLAILLARMNIEDVYFVYQSALEKTYHSQLLTKINRNINNQLKEIEAQFIFCIDTRSEGIRRHIEASGNYETFGYAGFFGCLFEWEDKIHQKCSLQSPAIVAPHIKLSIEQTKPEEKFNIIESIIGSLKEAKEHGFAPFAIFEMIGLYLSYTLYAKNETPNIFEKLIDKFSSAEQIAYLHALHKILNNIDYAPFVDNLYYLLTTIGLTRNMAEYVFICGHGSQMDNNPFQASYDCGACGGNSGALNAMVACALLNNAGVRACLKQKGIVFGDNTKFIAACHNTTTDELRLFNDVIASQVIPHHLINNISKASLALRNEKARALPGKRDVEFKKSDWAEMIPEWALANNACMIIGPRRLTENINLERRAFLHSYEPSLDPSGEILEGILTAPVIVAHWINAQYYFSSTDPHIYSSGNKAIHNVIPGIGVMEGNLSDLKIGLPLQGLFFQNKRVHEPRRLLVILYAHKEHLEAVFNKHQQVKAIFDNRWAFIHQLEPN